MQSKKEQRKAAAQSHMSFVKGVLAADTETSIASAKIYEDGEGRDLELPESEGGTSAVVAWKPLSDAIAAARGQHTCIIDPADYVRPASGYMNGNWNAESQICAVSNLAVVLRGLKKSFHDKNRKLGRGGLNSDRAAYIEGVAFTSGGEVKHHDVLAISPVNRKMALSNHRSEAECDIDAAHRVETLMRIAAARGVDELIVPPFGCEWGQGEPEDAAKLFADWISAHPGAISRVVFAIAGGPALNAFRERFPEEKRHVTVVDDSGEDDDEDNDDWRSDVTPVEDGRWVFD